MKLPFVVKKGWGSSCHQSPRTLSFTANRGSKTINSAYMEDDDLDLDGDDDCLIRGREREREYSIDHNNHIESVIRDLPSHQGQGRRLLFEPGESSSSSILEAKAPSASHSSESQVDNIDYYFKGDSSTALVVSMESRHPYLDFRNSMQEMLQAQYPHSLHHLLSCYLNLNRNSNHPYILAAFLDLLLSLPTPTTSSHDDSPSLSTSSLSSSFTTTTLSLHSSLQPQHHDASPTSSFMLQPS